jgi:lantibiotic modifying enzyme
MLQTWIIERTPIMLEPFLKFFYQDVSENQRKEEKKATRKSRDKNRILKVFTNNLHEPGPQVTTKIIKNNLWWICRKTVPLQ